MKSTDPAEYYTKWVDTKNLLGCACCIFSRCMQSDEVDILGALTCLLKRLKETDKLAS
jgi:hypothetical protein